MEKLPANNKITLETILVLAIAFLWNGGVYMAARLIAGEWHHYDLTTSFDRMIPFVPWTVAIYFGCYIFWGVNYYMCSRQEAGKRNRFFAADALAKAICFIIFIAIPTTNIRPEITDTGLWGFLMTFLYQIDSADNLFPSIHCLVSWLCWVGIRKEKSVSKGYRTFSFLMAVAVCISTLTTYQHVIADVIGGVLLAELTYYAAGNKRIADSYWRLIEKAALILRNIYMRQRGTRC